MHVFMVYVRDGNFSRTTPRGAKQIQVRRRPGQSDGLSSPGNPNPGPGSAPQGHQARLFDTCHPQMKAEHLTQAVAEERPDVVALSCLSTTTYPALKNLARRLKSAAPKIPLIAGGAFATMNADHILKDCPDLDCVAVGEGEELLPDYLDNFDDPGTVAGLVWRDAGEIVRMPPSTLAGPEPVPLPRPYQPAHRLHRILTPGCPRGPLPG